MAAKDIPMYHRRLTAAANAINEAVEMMEQAWFEDGHNPEFKKLHDAGYRLCVRYHNAWYRSVKRGRRDGWLEKR